MAWKIWVKTNKTNYPISHIPYQTYISIGTVCTIKFWWFWRSYMKFLGFQISFMYQNKFIFNPKYKSNSHYYLLDSDTNEFFCKLFKNCLCILENSVYLIDLSNLLQSTYIIPVHHLWTLPIYISNRHQHLYDPERHGETH